MKYTIQIRFLAILLACSFLSCTNSNSKGATSASPHFSHGRDLVAHLDRLFEQLSNNDPHSSDFSASTTKINEQIRKALERIRTKKLLLQVAKSYYLREHKFLFTLSDNAQLGVFSWNSRTDMLTNPTRNLAVYLHGEKAVPTSLYGDAIFYHEIHTIENQKKNTFYVLHGKGESQEKHDFHRIDAFVIKKDGLEEVPIFPGFQSSLISANFQDGIASAFPANFNFEKDGSLILKPEAWGPAVAYRSLKFGDAPGESKYFEGSYNLNKTLVKGDFNSKNDTNFINGSEIPIEVDETEQKTTFKFDDQIKIELTRQADDGVVQTYLSIYDSRLIKIQFDERTHLIGKKGDLLFFSGARDVNSQKIKLYDIGEQRLRWSKSMHDLLLMEDTLVYSEMVDALEVQNKNEIECGVLPGMDKAYFKVYSFKFNNQHPIVEYANQIFCGNKRRNDLAHL